MKKTRRIILMVCCSLAVFVAAGITEGSGKWSITGAISELTNRGNHTTDTNDTPIPTISNTDTPEPTHTCEMPTPPFVTPEITDTPEPVLTPEITDTPDISVTPDATGTPEISVTPETSGTPDVSVTPETTGTPTLSASPEPTDSPVIGDNTPTPTLIPVTPPTVTPEPTPEYYDAHVVIVKVSAKSLLNVRSGPGTNYKKVGEIYNGCYALVLEDLGEWLKIDSGQLKSQYISKKYVYTGYNAATLIDDMRGCEATITKNTNLRQGPCIAEDYTTMAKKGEKYIVHLSESTEDWLCVEINDLEVAYIKATDATLAFNMETGLTNEQIRMNTFAGKLEATLASDRNKPIETLPITNRLTDGSLTGAKLELFKNYQMSDLERDFFAAVVQFEVGGHPYSGKLACANVVINRMLTGYTWTGGNTGTITGVLTKPYQFAGANPFMTNWQIDPEKLAKYKPRVSAACYKAVDEAMAGVNNIPNYLFFQATRSAHSEAKDYPVLHYTEFTYIGDTYFYNGFHNGK